MRRLLRRALGYKEDPGTRAGSHVWLVAEGRPRIRWAYHDKRELAPIEVRNILVRQAGLTIDEARKVVARG
jgi:hypothetical protein